MKTLIAVLALSAVSTPALADSFICDTTPKAGQLTSVLVFAGLSTPPHTAAGDYQISLTARYTDSKEQVTELTRNLKLHAVRASAKEVLFVAPFGPRGQGRIYLTLPRASRVDYVSGLPGRVSIQKLPTLTPEVFTLSCSKH